MLTRKWSPPLLPSTAVGTLEFRAVQEPIRTIDGLGNYYQAKARTLDLSRRVLHCEDAFKKRPFQVAFDYLMIATGNKTNTFGVPGVMEREGKRVFFLKHLYHARQIRNRLLECFERAALPTCSESERSNKERSSGWTLLDQSSMVRIGVKASKPRA